MCRPRRRLAARASFPFPWSGPRALGWLWLGRGRRLLSPRSPAREDQSHLWVTLRRPEAPCPGDAETDSARTRLQLKDISYKQAKHTPGPAKSVVGRGELIFIIFLMYAVCQKHLRVVQIYHSQSKLSAYLTWEEDTGFKHTPLALRNQNRARLAWLTGLITGSYLEKKSTLLLFSLSQVEGERDCIIAFRGQN